MCAPVGTATSSGIFAPEETAASNGNADSDGAAASDGTGTTTSAVTFAPSLPACSKAGPASRKGDGKENRHTSYSGWNAVPDLCLLFPSTVMFYTAAQLCGCAESIFELPSSGHKYPVQG